MYNLIKNKFNKKIFIFVVVVTIFVSAVVTATDVFVGTNKGKVNVFASNISEIIRKEDTDSMANTSILAAFERMWQHVVAKLGDKVDKEDGKGLSSNDYTDEEKRKLAGLNSASYTHPSYTARTGYPTANAAPAFGGTFTVSQITSDATGHVTGATSRTVKIPNTAATTTTPGIVQLSSSTSSTSTTMAATSSAVKSAYDLADTANGEVQTLASQLGQNVKRLFGTGTSSAPIDISGIISSGASIIWFPSGYTYYISPLTITGYSDVTIVAHGATIIPTGTHAIKADSCPNIKFYGGIINGNNSAQNGIILDSCRNALFEGVTFKSFGSTSAEDVFMVHIVGDCTGFRVSNCSFDGANAGVISSDGYIHAYGLLINRKSSNNTYSSTGSVENCIFNNIAGTDNGSTKADGDGIFIQYPPYKDASSNTVVPVTNITIKNCEFNNCKKRGIKSKARGVVIENCHFTGAFWYAAIDMQVGHNTIRDCYIENTSNYTGSITSAIIASEGGCVIESCYISAEGGGAYKPGFRTATRMGDSPFAATDPWDVCVVNNCYFDKVSYGVYYGAGDGSVSYVTNGVEVTKCRFGAFTNRCMSVLSAMFSEVKSLSFVDFRLDYGVNRAEVKTTLSSFTYPIEISATVTESFDLYSKYWDNEPISSYSNLPSSTHARIIYEGDGMGGVTYKEYTAHGSYIVGTKDPESVTSTLGKQCLYNSKIGDRYTNSSNGSYWICTAAGTSSTVGTWAKLS